MTALPTLRIGSHTTPYPIIQGGMGIRVSGAKLAAAVANAGGVGIISAVGLGLNSPYFDPRRRSGTLFDANRLALIDELRLARAFSPSGIIGVNSMVAVRDHETLVRTAAEQGANVIISGAGLPLNLPRYTQDYPEVALVPIVSTVRAAKLICRRWEHHFHRLPDALIVGDSKRCWGALGRKIRGIGEPDLEFRTGRSSAGGLSAP